jgi:glutamate-1-semialdehyde 2,1-aminomutase
MVAGCEAALEAHGLPGYGVALGARGCVTFARRRIVDYATYLAQHDPELSRLTWLHAVNRGLLLAPGRPEQWTLSVAHTPADVAAYVEVFGKLSAALAGRSARRRDDRAAEHLAAAKAAVAVDRIL